MACLLLQLADNPMLTPLPGLHHDLLLPLADFLLLVYLIAMVRSSTCSSSTNSGYKRAVALMVCFNSWMTSCCPLYYLFIICATSTTWLATCCSLLYLVFFMLSFFWIGPCH